MTITLLTTTNVGRAQIIAPERGADSGTSFPCGTRYTGSLQLHIDEKIAILKTFKKNGERRELESGVLAVFRCSIELPTHFTMTSHPRDHPEHELAARYTSYKNPNLPFSTLQ